MRILVAYVGAAVAMAGLDLAWLKLTAATLYHPALGEMLAEKTNNAAAVVFYLIYIAGIVWFAVMPGLRSGQWSAALFNGALFGFFAYATYDLTNLATLKVWSLRVSAIDMAWGTFVTAVSALAGTLAAGLLSSR